MFFSGLVWWVPERVLMEFVLDPFSELKHDPNAGLHGSQVQHVLLVRIHIFSLLAPRKALVARPQGHSAP